MKRGGIRRTIPASRLCQFSAAAFAAILLVTGPASAQISDVAALTSQPAEDDFPSIAIAPDGRAYVVWVSHDITVPGDTMMLREWDGEGWPDAEKVTRGGEDLYRVEVAVDGCGRVVLVWAKNVGGNWELVAKSHSGQQVVQTQAPDRSARLLRTVVSSDRGWWLRISGGRRKRADARLTSRGRGYTLQARRHRRDGQETSKGERRGDSSAESPGRED